MIELHQKVRPDPEVVSTELENNEAVLLHLGTKNYFTLNDLGLRIWQILAHDSSVELIIEKIQEEYDVSPAKALESVLKFIDELMKEKLVKVSDE